MGEELRKSGQREIRPVCFCMLKTQNNKVFSFTRRKADLFSSADVGRGKSLCLSAWVCG